MIQKVFVTTVEAATMLGYTIQHVRLLIRKGQLKAEKVGRDWLVDRNSLTKFLSKRDVV